LGVQNQFDPGRSHPLDGGDLVPGHVDKGLKVTGVLAQHPRYGPADSGDTQRRDPGMEEAATGVLEGPEDLLLRGGPVSREGLDIPFLEGEKGAERGDYTCDVEETVLRQIPDGSRAYPVGTETGEGVSDSVEDHIGALNHVGLLHSIRLGVRATSGGR